jgi:opacity protein-like surface antigen
MKQTLKKFCAVAVLAAGLAVSASAQVIVNPVNLATNTVPTSTTTTADSNYITVGSRSTFNLFSSVTPTLNSTNGAGTGSLIQTVQGSPDSTPNSGSLWFAAGYLTNTYSTTNPVTAYASFSVASFQSVKVSALNNTGTNLVATNLVDSYLCK